MQNDAATLHCPNDLCKAPNRQTDKFCQRCGTLLIKRYLWAVGEFEVSSGDKGVGISLGESKDLLAERYLQISNRIFLDTKPSLVPETPSSEITEAIKPYLRLVPYRLQIPQVYALVPAWEGQTALEILLLEQAPIYPDGMPLEGQLMPELTDVWKEATSMRQLNWLWQMAQLWQPLSSEKVASSLLEPGLLRVEGSLVRLLECIEDYNAPTLASLGYLWKEQLAKGARPAIASFFERLCQTLIQGEVRSSEQLVALLDRALAEVGRQVSTTIQITTCTDKGPSRQRNEDACYPPSGTTITPLADAEALAIVCDGIGGHEGGNVASNLAIETLHQQIQKILLEDAHLDATTLSTELERSACAANDRISQRNDHEHRHGRQRMGTTLVMALARAHEIYIAHVGDSRAYWITRTGCHQVTLDDDVASREVRLGYALYRDALQQTSSGSLVQALGMSPSASLHPTVQRFVLDEDCVFLLCSDGLSDYDLVDQCWKTEILPILDGKVDLATAAARLVEIGNTQNGHDNVTVGLVHCQVSCFEPSTVSAEIAQPITLLPEYASASAKKTNDDSNNLEQPNAAQQSVATINLPESAVSSLLQTQLMPSLPAPRRSFMPVLVGIILLLTLGGGLFAYLWKHGLLKSITDFGSTSIDPPEHTSAPAAELPVPKETNGVLSLEVGSLIQIKNLATDSAQERTFPLLLRLDSEPPNNQKVIGYIPDGSVLQVRGITAKQSSLEDNWLRLKVCSTPATRSKARKPNPTPPTYQPVQTENEGSIRVAEISPFILSKPRPPSPCPSQASATHIHKR